MGNVHPFSPADWATANLKTSRADHGDQEGSTSQQREELVQQIGLRYIKGVVAWSKKIHHLHRECTCCFSYLFIMALAKFQHDPSTLQACHLTGI